MQNRMNRFQNLLIAAVMTALIPARGYGQFFVGETEVDTSTVASHLDTPWEILWGPDDHIWFTERYGRISRLNPETGEINELITISGVHEQNESGLLGMVLHPDFANHPYVYVVYNYLDSPYIKERLVRYTYVNGTLESPVTLIEDIEGNTNHDGSRLVIDQNLKLFMTTGDAAYSPNAQDMGSLSGKMLRMNLDGSIPEDNPIEGSYLWSWGHRNAQGLVLAPSGILYSSEHGPDNSDELNIIEKGRNYGWPTVEGFCDEAGETQFCTDSMVAEPLTEWSPTLATAGLDYYDHEAIPEWRNSLLLVTLKEREMLVLGLSPDGRSIEKEEVYFKFWFGRLRDICVSPQGKIFLAVSNRDGRGAPESFDDRIVEIVSVNYRPYCRREVTASICPGDAYNFYGMELTQPGNYTDTVTGGPECDTIVTLHLDGSVEYHDEIEASICEGDSMLFNGEYLDIPGIYTDTLSTETGCDSVVTLTLSYSNEFHYQRDLEICQGDSVQVNGVYLREEGEYIDTFATALGCDSIVVSNVSFFREGNLISEDTLVVNLNEAVTVSAKPGLELYRWNEDPPTTDNTLAIHSGELGEGVHVITLVAENPMVCFFQDSVVLIVLPETGLREHPAPEFSIYPNPVSGSYLNIRYSVGHESVLVLYDAMGKEISRSLLDPRLDHAMIRIPDSRGLYFVSLIGDNGPRTVKVLKK